MVATSIKARKGSDMLVHGMEWKALYFKLCPTIVESLDPIRAQLRIPSKVLLINDICSYFHYTIQEIGILEMDETLKSLSVNGVLKPEDQHLEVKGLTHITHMLQNFYVKWIRFILSQVHDG